MSAEDELAQLTHDEAVAWVMAQTRSRKPFAVRTVAEARAGSTPYGMTFDGEYWTVPAWSVQGRP